MILKGNDWYYEIELRRRKARPRKSSPTLPYSKVLSTPTKYPKPLVTHSQSYTSVNTADTTPGAGQTLVSPVSFDKVGAISGHATQESLRAEKAQQTTWTHGIFSTYAKFDMTDAQSEQRGQGVVQDGAISTVELSDGSQGEGKRHVLEEILMAAILEEQRVHVGIIGAFGVVRLQLVAHELLVLDALVHDTVAEEEQVGREGQSPCAGDGCAKCQ